MSSSKSSRNARLAAARAVNDVMAGRIGLEQALTSQKAYETMVPRDRAFAHLITATTFRRMGQIDKILSEYMEREPHIMVQHFLRTAAAQMLFLGTPAHAVVAETVQIVKKERRPAIARASGMVNAILRRLGERADELAEQEANISNIPDWLSERWMKQYGPKPCAGIARVYAKTPPLDLTVKSDAQGWADKLGGQVLPGGFSVRLPQIGDVRGLEGFEQGEWWVQDIAAALPIHVLGELRGKKALDMCCAPGGKTMQLAHAGADVTAIDASKTRLKRVEENLKRTNLSAKLINADAAKWRGLRDGEFDVVFLDAPCTATGTLRRNPEVPHIKRKKMMRELEDIQKSLLEAAARNVKPGGTLVYAVCSLQKEEAEDIVWNFIKSRSDFSLNSILLPEALDLHIGKQDTGFIRTLPSMLEDLGGMDGFFSAHLTRNI